MVSYLYTNNFLNVFYYWYKILFFFPSLRIFFYLNYLLIPFSMISFFFLYYFHLHLSYKYEAVHVHTMLFALTYFHCCLLFHQQFPVPLFRSF